jgi:hypothetical protein
MTFEDLLSQWQRGQMLEQKRHLLARLTGPERLWFGCCRDLARLVFEVAPTQRSTEDEA